MNIIIINSGGDGCDAAITIYQSTAVTYADDPRIVLIKQRASEDHCVCRLCEQSEHMMKRMWEVVSIFIENPHSIILDNVSFHQILSQQYLVVNRIADVICNLLFYNRVLLST